MAGCFSTRPEKNQATGDAYCIAPDRLYSDFKEMAAKEAARPDPIDFAVIVTPNFSHYEAAKAFLEAGINVLSDKPMAINSRSFKLLEECFDIAREKNIMLYDIMTERNEITTMLQRELSTIPAVYGEQLKGSPEEPAIVKESVHHLFKLVDNKPLTRPVWYLDVTQQGGRHCRRDDSPGRPGAVGSLPGAGYRL